MKNHHLFSLVKTFDRKEMTRFKDFALSPYHNKHKDTRTLILYLHKIYPDFKPKLCDREYIWKKIFSNPSFDYSKLALLFTYAWRLAERFLVQEHQNASHVFDLSLLYELRNRKQWPAYERQWKKSADKLNNSEKRDIEYYRYALNLAEEGNQSYIQQARRKEDFSLIEKERRLDQYYILEKLRDAVEMQVRRQILQGDYSERLLEAILQELKDNLDNYSEVPGIQVYYLLYQMMGQPSLLSYRKALNAFQDNEIIFPINEIAGIYIYFQNFCISRINKNEKSFLREIFNLYKNQLERNLLYENDFLIEWHYKNIVTTAIRLGELDWANIFIENYKNALKEEARENAYSFNKAAYCYAIGDFDEVLNLLTQVEYHDFRYNLGAKVLLLRVYYERNEFEALDALVESFRQYLQRNRLMADTMKSGMYSVFRITRRIAKIKTSISYTPRDKILNTINKLNKDLNETETIFNRTWLENKIEDLKKELE